MLSAYVLSWNCLEIMIACNNDECSKRVSSSLSSRVERLDADSLALIGNAMTTVSLPDKKALVREKVKCTWTPSIRDIRSDPWFFHRNGESLWKQNKSRIGLPPDRSPGKSRLCAQVGCGSGSQPGNTWCWLPIVPEVDYAQGPE